MNEFVITTADAWYNGLALLARAVIFTFPMCFCSDETMTSLLPLSVSSVSLTNLALIVKEICCRLLCFVAEGYGSSRMG